MICVIYVGLIDGILDDMEVQYVLTIVIQADTINKIEVSVSSKLSPISSLDMLAVFIILSDSLDVCLNRLQISSMILAYIFTV